MMEGVNRQESSAAAEYEDFLRLLLKPGRLLMLALFNKHKQKQSLIGLEICSDGIALACYESTGLIRLSDYLPLPAEDDDPGEALKQLVKKHRLQDISTIALMPAGFYSLLQLSSPPMKQAELRASIRWRVQELIPYPAEEAVVDVFEFPESGQRGVERMLYVAAARSADVARNVAWIRQAELNLRALDIGELALRNIIARLKENTPGAVVLYLAETSGLLVFIKDSELYLARRLDVGMKQVKMAAETGQYGNIAEQVQLELQRSLDYFEGHFVQPLPARLLVFPRREEVWPLLEQVRQNLNLEVIAPNLQVFFKDGSVPDERVQSRCLLAMGAAMREDLS